MDTFPRALGSAQILRNISERLGGLEPLKRTGTAVEVLRDIETFLNESTNLLTDKQQLEVVVLLASGERVYVQSFATKGRDAIVISGYYSNRLPCRVFVHYSKLQVLVEALEEVAPRPQIIFSYPDKQSS